MGVPIRLLSLHSATPTTHVLWAETPVPRDLKFDSSDWTRKSQTTGRRKCPHGSGVSVRTGVCNYICNMEFPNCQFPAFYNMGPCNRDVPRDLLASGWGEHGIVQHQKNSQQVNENHAMV
ncbi:hypothetical protein GDO86_019906 [Hymenochirus boettgeri]|uniref:Uncharacterized protein n=1 Tax=Hymenochirus boettgeri TaxID=247094 RepID=A0A8T2IMQ2_9PIPI|nr:hypothetical protein GDO86_019906 [Hymenochirus boettgeri]